MVAKANDGRLSLPGGIESASEVEGDAEVPFLNQVPERGQLGQMTATTEELRRADRQQQAPLLAGKPFSLPNPLGHHRRRWQAFGRTIEIKGDRGRVELLDGLA
jgi:hypothetical protein